MILILLTKMVMVSILSDGIGRDQNFQGSPSVA